MGSGPENVPHEALIIVVPQFSLQREHNQGQVLLFTSQSEKKNAIGGGLRFWSDFFFLFSPDPTLVESFSLTWSMTTVISLLLAIMFSFFQERFVPLYILVSDPAVGGWLHWFLTKSSGPAAGRQKWMDRLFGLKLILVSFFMLRFCYCYSSTSSSPLAGYIKPPMWSYPCTHKSQHGFSRAKKKREFQTIGIVQVSCPGGHMLHSICYSANCKLKFCATALHSGVIFSTVLSFNARPKMWCESGPQICNYFEEHADAVFFYYYYFDKQSRDPGCSHECIPSSILIRSKFGCVRQQRCPKGSFVTVR